MLQTVRGDFEGFDNREVEKANLARRAQIICGYPYDKWYVWMVINSTDIENCPVSPTDITNACIIYVLDLSGVWGKNVRKKLIMDQNVIRQSTRNRHSTNSYTTELSNKYHDIGTLHLNVSE